MKKLIVLSLALAATIVSFSQKIGHLDRTALIKVMPETVEVEKKLAGIQQEYTTTYQMMEQEYNTMVQEAQAKQKEWPEAILQTKIKAIQDKEQQISQFEQQAAQDLQDQQAKLYQPIVDKATKAIEDVAKENGFAYIIDSGIGVLLYTGGEDVGPLVRTKLGISNTQTPIPTPTPQPGPAPKK